MQPILQPGTADDRRAGGDHLARRAPLWRVPPPQLQRAAGWAAYGSAAGFLTRVILPSVVGVPTGPRTASASLALLLMQVMDLVLPLLLVPIVVVLAQLTRPSRLNHLALASGLVYTGACVLLTLLYARYARLPARSDAHELRVVGAILQAVPATALGLWLLLAHSLAWHQRVVSSGLASLGLLVGMGHLLTLPQRMLPIVRLWMNGGPPPLASSRVQTLMGVGMMGGLVIIVSYPFWLIALGRRLRARPRIGCTSYPSHPTAHE